MFLLEDTIAALASAPGPAGCGIIRCSGPGILEVVAPRFDSPEMPRWKDSKVAKRYSGIWLLGEEGCPLPIDLYVWPTARSYTGQPAVEVHLIGSPPLCDAVLADLFAGGARPAQPGEFTLRAFLAGRVDLMQAEAVLGVIDAVDPHQLSRALNQLAGGVSGGLTQMRSDLLDLLADLEAGLDFTEEGIEFVSQSVLVCRISVARSELQRLIADAGTRTRHIARPRVILVGPANAGKSTLFNALAERSLALVSPIAGTTRDYLMAELDIDGLVIDLVDTAGFETTPDGILQASFELREHQLERADLVLECIPADQRGTAIVFEPVKLTRQVPVIQIQTKCDIKGAPSDRSVSGTLAISAITGEGLVELRAAIKRALMSEMASESVILESTAARCLDSLSQAEATLARAESFANAAAGEGEEFLAADVREALEHLGQVTGAVYTDDVLDRIFSKFCIGK